MPNYRLLALSSSRRERMVGDGVCYFGYDVSSFEDTAIMHIDDYENVFGRKRSQASTWYKRLSVVRITYKDRTEQHSIYRKFRPSRNASMKDCVAVSYHSLLFLKDGDNNIAGRIVNVSRSNWVLFYWNHPNEVVQTSIALGIISLFLGLISFIVSIVSIL